MLFTISFLNGIRYLTTIFTQACGQQRCGSVEVGQFVQAATLRARRHDQTSQLRQPMALTPDSATCAERPSSESLKMTQERVGGSLVFIHSDTAVFSNAARRAARSHAATFSQRRRPMRKAKLKSPKDDGSVTRRSRTPADSSVCDPDVVLLSPAKQECPHLISPPGSPSPITLLDTALLDPFESTALPMSRKMSGLLRGCEVSRPLQERFSLPKSRSERNP